MRPSLAPGMLMSAAQRPEISSGLLLVTPISEFVTTEIASPYPLKPLLTSATHDRYTDRYAQRHCNRTGDVRLLIIVDRHVSRTEWLQR